MSVILSAKMLLKAKLATAEETAIRIIQDAEQAGETKRKEALMEAKEEIHACAAKWNVKIKNAAAIAASGAQTPAKRRKP